MQHREGTFELAVRASESKYGAGRYCPSVKPQLPRPALRGLQRGNYGQAWSSATPKPANCRGALDPEPSGLHQGEVRTVRRSNQDRPGGGTAQACRTHLLTRWSNLSAAHTEHLPAPPWPPRRVATCQPRTAQTTPCCPSSSLF
jgi:hypothetical protein